MAKSDTFRAQHQQALEIIKSIQAGLSPARLAVDPKGAAANLAKLAGVVHIHLSMEDRSLYPELMNHANPHVRQVAKEFVQEMGGISTAFAAYCKRWNAATIKVSPDLFIQETRRIISTLSSRIRREEMELYPLADKD